MFLYGILQTSGQRLASNVGHTASATVVRKRNPSSSDNNTSSDPVEQKDGNGESRYSDPNTPKEQNPARNHDVSSVDNQAFLGSSERVLIDKPSVKKDCPSAAGSVSDLLHLPKEDIRQYQEFSKSSAGTNATGAASADVMEEFIISSQPPAKGRKRKKSFSIMTFHSSPSSGSSGHKKADGGDKGPTSTASPSGSSNKGDMVKTPQKKKKKSKKRKKAKLGNSMKTLCLSLLLPMQRRIMLYITVRNMKCGELGQLVLRTDSSDMSSL